MVALNVVANTYRIVGCSGRDENVYCISRAKICDAVEVSWIVVTFKRRDYGTSVNRVHAILRVTVDRLRFVW